MTGPLTDEMLDLVEKHTSRNQGSSDLVFQDGCVEHRRDGFCYQTLSLRPDLPGTDIFLEYLERVKTAEEALPVLIAEVRRLRKILRGQAPLEMEPAACQLITMPPVQLPRVRETKGKRHPYLGPKE